MGNTPPASSSASPSTGPSTGHSFVLVTSDNSSSSPAGLDWKNEQTVEFIVKVLNKVLQNADEHSVDCADDSAILQSDSDGSDEELNDNSIIAYLKNGALIKQIRSDRPVLQPSSAGDSEGDSKLAKIVSMLNAAKLRSLNANKHPAEKPADPLESKPLPIPRNQKPIQLLPNHPPQYQQDFPDLSTANLRQPSWPQVDQTRLIDDFSQKLNLNKTNKPPLGERPSNSALPASTLWKPALLDHSSSPALLAGVPWKPPFLGNGLTNSALQSGVIWKPSFLGDSLWKPASADAGKEPDEEEDYRQADIKIEKGKCHYCKLSDPNCVLKCSNCPLYFCNGQGQASFSHILTHLKNSDHSEIDFKFDGVVGSPNSCALCNSANVFDLGFISSNKGNRYLLCRPPCKQTVIEERDHKQEKVQKPIFESFDEYFAKLRKKLEPVLINGECKLRADETGLHFPSDGRHEVTNLAKWKPLISERCLIEFVVGKPKKPGRSICSKVSVAEIEEIEKKLEAVRAAKERARRGVDAKDLIDEHAFVTVVDVPVLLRYESGQEYREVFCNLAKLENAFGRLTKEEKLGQSYVYQQTIAALKRFSENKKSMDPRIYEIILGHRTIESSAPDDLQFSISYYEAPKLPALNHSQALAIKHSLENPLTLIQGPPGTGKTTTSASIVYHLSKLDKRRKEQILVCAPSNIASDHLALKIRETGLKVVRLLSKTKEEDRSYKSPLSISAQLDRPPPYTELGVLVAHLKRQKKATKEDNWRLKQLRKAYEKTLLNNADVICVTCVTSADARLSERKFKYLLIDEVAQCTEPEVILPLTRSGIQKLILIGDIQQLSPVIKNKEAVKKGYDQSLMLRLVALGNKSFMLNQQYRMHPQLSRFSREQFYDSLLKDGVSEQDRILADCTFRWPTNKPMFFYSCKEEEQTSGTGHSYLNRKEGMVIAKMVRKLVCSGIAASQIGIITPYSGHRQHLRMNLKFFSRDIDYEKIEIESINAFQGREKDIIILSCVRSNKMFGRASIGFLGDSRRLNVALTRAKYGMIIVGDHSTLMNEPVWFELLLFYKNNNLIFKGDLEKLELLACRLRKPKAKGQKDSKAKGNYFSKSENGAGEKGVQYQKV